MHSRIQWLSVLFVLFFLIGVIAVASSATPRSTERRLPERRVIQLKARERKIAYRCRPSRPGESRNGDLNTNSDCRKISNSNDAATVASSNPPTLENDNTRDDRTTTNDAAVAANNDDTRARATDDAAAANNNFTPLDAGNDFVSGWNREQNRERNRERSFFEALADLRFNKNPPRNDADRLPNDNYVGGVHRAVFPLVASDYPISGDKAAVLRSETMADAVVLSNDFQLFGEAATADRWLIDPVTNATINPAYPTDAGGNPNDVFWRDLRDVVQTQVARRNGGEGASPDGYNRWPDLWADKTTLTDMARAVQGEYPASIQGAYVETVYQSFRQNYDANNNRMQLDLGQPLRSFTDFIGDQARMACINAWSFEAVGPVNFMLKWYFGVPRPEEIAWRISTGELTEQDGVPADLVETIGAMDLRDAHDFTAYPVGCPTHPSFPAMHSAGSTVSLWFPGLYRITGEQYCEALRVDYATAYARTVAGVHYQQDNLAGLNIGQRLIREFLPTFVEENYSYDASRVSTRLESLSFDWNTFDSEACTIDGVPAAEFLNNANGGLIIQ